MTTIRTYAVHAAPATLHTVAVPMGLASDCRDITDHNPTPRPDMRKARAAVARARRARFVAPVTAVASFVAATAALVGFGGAQ